MIRCYEAKLSKNLNPRVRSFIMKEWMEKRNTYGIELKKYIIRFFISRSTSSIRTLYKRSKSVWR